MANGLVKRGGIWHFDFRYKKTRYQGTTGIRNHEKAKVWLNTYRTNLAFTGVGLVEKEPAPILSVFLKGPFLDSVRQNAKKPRSAQFYGYKVKQLCQHPPFTQLRLDRVDELAIQAYKDFRMTQKKAAVTINRELGTLRKALRFAEDCKLITRAPRVRLLPNENRREFVIDGEMEKRYLSLADYPLREVAILMLDLGLRPGEAVNLRKSDITTHAVAIRDGKTVNSRRSLPQTERTRTVLELCFALFPASEWVFPGSKGQHFTAGAISNLHTDLRKEHELPAEFVLYSCRHTFGTRLAQSGANEYEIKKAMGHASILVSQRYIHPSGDDIGLAMKRKEMMDKLLRGESVTTEITTPVKKP